MNDQDKCLLEIAKRCFEAHDCEMCDVTLYTILDSDQIVGSCPEGHYEEAGAFFCEDCLEPIYFCSDHYHENYGICHECYLREQLEYVMHVKCVVCYASGESVTENTDFCIKCTQYYCPEHIGACECH